MYTSLMMHQLFFTANFVETSAIKISSPYLQYVDKAGYFEINNLIEKVNSNSIYNAIY